MKTVEQWAQEIRDELGDGLKFDQVVSETDTVISRAVRLIRKEAMTEAAATYAHNLTVYNKPTP